MHITHVVDELIEIKNPIPIKFDWNGDDYISSF